MLIHYCIMQVDDRCRENVENTKRMMSDAGHVFIDRKYFDWRERDARSYLAKHKVSVEKWSECSHRGLPPLEGELGHVSSMVDMLIDLQDRGIGQVVVFEDDCITDERLVESIERAARYEYDVFNLSYVEDQWRDFGTEEDIIDDFAVRANFKRGFLTATLYSSHGISKLLKILRRMGVVGASDLTIDEYGRRGYLNCLCVNPDTTPSAVQLETLSIIDPDNIRHSEIVV